MPSPLQIAVIGAGPVGLAAAIAISERGRSVEVFEQRQAPPLGKACGEGLMPDAMESLERLGVDLPAGRSFFGIRYLDELSDVCGSFPSRPGRGVRRLELHNALLERARACGVQVHWSSPVQLRPVDRERFALRCMPQDETFHPEVIVAADGLRSRSRVDSGLAAPRRASGRDERYGLRCHFGVAPWSDRVEVHWGRGAEAYVTPTARDEVGVAFLFRGRLDRGERSHGDDPLSALLHRFPALAHRLQGVERTSAVRGVGPLRQPTRKLTTRNLYLVGDAAGYVDAITGEGLALGFYQASALAEAVSAGRPARYERLVRQHRRLPDLATWLTLLLSRRPGLRRRVLVSLAKQPGRFDRLLAIHCRERPWASGLPVLVGLVLSSARDA